MFKKKNLIFFLHLIILMLLSPGIMARDYVPEEIKNPNIANRYNYVADPGNLLNEQTTSEINKTLYSLRLNTGAEVGVAIIPSIGDMPIEEFSGKLFSDWALGKSDKDNGVLILVVPELRKARIETGYGVEGILPDISVKKILDKDLAPAMREGDINRGVSNVVNHVSAVLSDPAVAEELRSDEKEVWEAGPQSDLSGEDIWNLVGWVVILLFIGSCIIFINDYTTLRKKDRYFRAQEWHRRRPTYITLAVLSLGLGLIPFFLAEWQRKKTRNAPMSCPTCKAKMRKLNEEEDNELLSPSQDLEEKLNTVDYDVWVCPDCGTVEQYPFKINQKNFTECPRCHTIAFGLVRDHTLSPATTRRAGVGEKIYECRYCHHHRKNKYVIPKREDTSLAAAAILGSALGRGHSGGIGGGFGGGFGGGHSGGGGATGSW